jgi:hypothetical protein
MIILFSRFAKLELEGEPTLSSDAHILKHKERCRCAIKILHSVRVPYKITDQEGKFVGGLI